MAFIEDFLSLSLCLQEKVLLWLLQFMQEQAISLDEVDQNGNTAVHVAAQYGHLTCIQVRSVQRAAAFSLTQAFSGLFARLHGFPVDVMQRSNNVG